MGDFNKDGSETAIRYFMEIYNLKNLVKHPNYFKNSDRPSSNSKTQKLRL